MLSRRTLPILLFALVAVAGADAQPRSRAARAESAPRAVAPRGPLSADEQQTIGIFERTSPSVVYITTVQHVRDFFSRNVTRVPQGTGSGFIWDELGNVVTNFHVIQGAQKRDHAVRPAQLSGVASRREPRARHRSAAHRRADRRAEGGADRLERRPQGRTERLCDRQSVRPRSHADDRHHLGVGPLDRRRARRRDRRRHPDRRSDQPRQLGRAVARQRGPADRHQHR